jgi:hypothetical protein
MTEDPSGDLEPLSEDLRDFLEAERELDVPGADLRERLLARIAPLLIAPPGGAPDANHADAAGAVSGATGTVVKAGLGAKLLVPAICTLLGAAGGAATHAYLTARRPPVPLERSVGSATTPLPAPLPSASAPASAASSEASAPQAVTAPAASASSRATPQPALPGSLRAERLLLESATAALMRGDNASAMASLQKHAHQYPRGALSEEREVLWIKVLRAQGNHKAAEQRASDFKRKFPASLQQGAVERPGGLK